MAQPTAAAEGRGFAGWLSRLLCRLSAGAADRLAAILGWLWFRLLRIRRRVTLDNLRRAFPGLERRNRLAVAAACYRHLTCSAFEFLRLPQLLARPAHQLFALEGEEHLQQARRGGRGVIVVTGHLGNFDLLACFAAQRWGRIYVVSREQKTSWVNRFWMESRRRWGVEILPARGSAMRLHRLLKRGALVALLIDQHTPHGLVCDFFGRPAACTPAPALLAYQTGAVLLPVWCERVGRERHRLHIDPPWSVDSTRPRREEVQRVTCDLNRWLEGCIRRRPEQWLWLHRRWKL